MFMKVRTLLLAGLLGLALPAAARAQIAAPPDPSDPQPPPATLAYVEGDVDVIHEGLVERADPPLMLVDGDLVRTHRGRAEIVFPDGTLLHLDEGASLEVMAPRRLRLAIGRVRVRVSPAVTQGYVVDTPAGRVALDARGEYGIDVDSRTGLEVSVSRGVAEIGDAPNRDVVRAGERAVVPGYGARPALYAFNSARWDAFDRWSQDRALGFASTASAGYLPYELRSYGPVLDRYGRWDHVAPYGAVWVPSVGVSWRPYYDGSWAHTRYGWTWYGVDRWAWPTHHYGRWGFSGAFWYWIPTKVWGPAWVSWAFGPSYVSWAPLGFDNRPVVGFSGRPDHPIYAPHFSPWRAWTVVPRDRFGPRSPVRASAVDGDRLDEGARRAMVVQNRPPASPVGGALPRTSPSIAGGSPGARRGPVETDRPGLARRPTGSSDAAPRRQVVDAPAYTPDDPRPDTGAARAPGAIYRRVPSSDERSTYPRDAPRETIDRVAPVAPRATDAPARTVPDDRGDRVWRSNPGVERGQVRERPASPGPSRVTPADEGGGARERGPRGPADAPRARSAGEAGGGRPRGDGGQVDGARARAGGDVAAPARGNARARPR
jgi:hypothetical protein